MAADKVVRVRVEAKNLKETTSEARKLNAELDRAEKTRKAGTRTGSRAADAALSSSGDVGLRRGTAASGSRGDSRDFARQAQGLGGLVHVYATFAANIFAVSAAFSALSKAMDFQRMQAGMKALEVSTGRGLSAIAKNMRDATSGAISLTESIRFTNLTTAAGFSSVQIEGLTKAARGASSALGRDLADAMDRLVRGTAKLEPELLDELGLLTRTQKAGEAYAKSIGKTFEQLTQFEKTQAFTNAVIAEAEQKYGAIADAVDENPYTKLVATLDNASKAILSIMNTAIVPLIKVFADSPALVGGAILAITALLLNKAVPSISKWADSNAIAAQRAGAAQQEFAERTVAAQQRALKGRKDALRAEHHITRAAYVEQKAMSFKHFQELQSTVTKAFTASSAISKKMRDANFKNFDVAEFTKGLGAKIAAARKANDRALESKNLTSAGATSPQHIQALNASKEMIQLRQKELDKVLDISDKLKLSLLTDEKKKKVLLDAINARRQIVSLGLTENDILRKSYLQQQQLLQVTTARKNAQAQIASAIEVGTLSHVVSTLRDSWSTFNGELSSTEGLTNTQKAFAKLKFAGSTTFTALTTGAAILGRTILNIFFGLGTILTVFELVTSKTKAFSKEGEKLASVQKGMDELLDSNVDKLGSLDRVMLRGADTAATLSKKLEIVANIGEDLSANVGKIIESFSAWARTDLSFIENMTNKIKGLVGASREATQANLLSGVFENLVKTLDPAALQSHIETLASSMTVQLGVRIPATLQGVREGFKHLEDASAASLLGVGSAVEAMADTASAASTRLFNNFKEVQGAVSTIVEAVEAYSKVEFKDKKLGDIVKGITSIANANADVKALAGMLELTDDQLTAMVRKNPEYAQMVKHITSLRDIMKGSRVEGFTEAINTLTNGNYAGINNLRNRIESLYRELEDNRSSLALAVQRNDQEEISRLSKIRQARVAELDKVNAEFISKVKKSDLSDTYKNALTTGMGEGFRLFSQQNHAVTVAVNFVTANGSSIRDIQSNLSSADTALVDAPNFVDSFKAKAAQGIANRERLGQLSTAAFDSSSSATQNALQGVVGLSPEAQAEAKLASQAAADEAEKLRLREANKTSLDKLNKLLKERFGIEADTLKVARDQAGILDYTIKSMDRLVTQESAAAIYTTESLEARLESLSVLKLQKASEGQRLTILEAELEKRQKLHELSTNEDLSAKDKATQTRNINNAYGIRVKLAKLETQELTEQARLEKLGGVSSARITAIANVNAKTNEYISLLQKQGLITKDLADSALDRSDANKEELALQEQIKAAVGTSAEVVLKAKLETLRANNKITATILSEAQAEEKRNVFLALGLDLVSAKSMSLQNIASIEKRSAEAIKASLDTEIEKIMKMQGLENKHLLVLQAKEKARKAELDLLLKTSEATLRNSEIEGRFDGGFSRAASINFAAQAESSAPDTSSISVLNKGVISSVDGVAVKVGEMIQTSQFNTRELIDSFRNSLSDAFRDAAVNQAKELWRRLIPSAADVQKNADSLAIQTTAAATSAMATAMGANLDVTKTGIDSAGDQVKNQTTSLTGKMEEMGKWAAEKTTAGFQYMGQVFTNGLASLRAVMAGIGGGSGGGGSDILGTLLKAGVGYLSGGWAGAAASFAGSATSSRVNANFASQGSSATSMDYSSYYQVADTIDFAKGGVMTKYGALDLNAYSSGGIANSPQLALFGEGRQNEAYVPLPDGKTIPVTMQGGGSSTNNFDKIEINVTMDGGSTRDNDTGASARDLGKQMASQIKGAVLQELMTQSRPGGLLHSSTRR